MNIIVNTLTDYSNSHIHGDCHNFTNIRCSVSVGMIYGCEWVNWSWVTVSFSIVANTNSNISTNSNRLIVFISRISITN